MTRHAVYGSAALTIGVVLLAAGCMGDQPQEGSFQPATLETGHAVDRAGVRIVEESIRTRNSQTTWHLASQPDVVIGADEQAGLDYVLEPGARAVLLDDGRVVIADGHPARMRWFSQSGQLLRIAQSGRGPGELQSATFLDRVPGDTVVVYDGDLGRWSIFDRDGAFVRSVQLSQSDFRAFGGFKGAFTSTTAYSSAVLFPSDTTDDFRRYGLALLRVSLDSLRADTITILKGQETVFFYVDYPLNWSRSSPLANNAYHTGSAAGIVAGESDDFQLTWFAPDGTALQRLEVERDAPALTKADIEAAMDTDRQEYERQQFRNTDPARRRMLQDSYDRFEKAVRHPARLPAFSKLLVDDHGTVWAQLFTKTSNPGTGTEWVVFGSDGRFLAYIDVPDGLRIHDVQPDRVIGIVRDSLGVETASVYKVER